MRFLSCRDALPRLPDERSMITGRIGLISELNLGPIHLLYGVYHKFLPQG